MLTDCDLLQAAPSSRRHRIVNSMFLKNEPWADYRLDGDYWFVVTK